MFVCDECTANNGDALERRVGALEAAKDGQRSEVED
jgi:hypothetical protein